METFKHGAIHKLYAVVTYGTSIP